MHARLPNLTSIALFAVSVFSVIVAGATAPAGRYTISSGTVYDTKTQLTWEQSPPTSPSNYMAAAHCSSLGTGWRVPTWQELITIMDYSQRSPPLLDPTAFPPPQPSGTYYTSAAPCSVDTSTGAATCGACDGTPPSQAYVRCVK